MSHKKILVPVLIASALFVVSYLWTVSAKHTDDLSSEENGDVELVDTSHWLTYENEEYGYSIQYPRSWDVAEEGDEVYFGPPESKVGGYIWGISIYQLSDLEDTIAEIGHQFTDRKEKRESITLDSGEEGLLVTVTTDTYPDWVSKTVFVNHDNILVAIGNGAVHSDDFDSFYKSINFLTLIGEEVDTTDLLTYENAEYGFTLKHPNTWEVESEEGISPSDLREGKNIMQFQWFDDGELVMSILPEGGFDSDRFMNAKESVVTINDLEIRKLALSQSSAYFFNPYTNLNVEARVEFYIDEEIANTLFESMEFKGSLDQEVGTGIDTSDWLAYQNTRVGFSLRYPSDWKVEWSPFEQCVYITNPEKVSVRRYELLLCPLIEKKGSMSLKEWYEDKYTGSNDISLDRNVDMIDWKGVDEALLVTTNQIQNSYVISSEKKRPVSITASDFNDAVVSQILSTIDLTVESEDPEVDDASWLNFESSNRSLAFRYNPDWKCSEIIPDTRVDCYPSSRESEEYDDGLGVNSVYMPDIVIRNTDCELAGDVGNTKSPSPHLQEEVGLFYRFYEQFNGCSVDILTHSYINSEEILSSILR